MGVNDQFTSSNHEEKMKIKLMLAAVGLTLGGTLLLAVAQENSPNDAPLGEPADGNAFHHRPPPNLILEALDPNRDGIIDANEIATAPAALKPLDKNGDGQITWDEIRPPRPPVGDPNLPPPGDLAGPGGPESVEGPGPGPTGDFHPGPPPNRLFMALDANHDGMIDGAEIANAPAALEKLDKNGDGQLTLEEIRPPRPARAAGGPGEGNPGGEAGENPPPMDNN